MSTDDSHAASLAPHDPPSPTPDADRRAAKHLTNLGQLFWLSFLVQVNVGGHALLFPVLALLLGREIRKLSVGAPSAEVRRGLHLTVGCAGSMVLLSACSWLPGRYFAGLELVAMVIGLAAVATYATAMSAWCEALDRPGSTSFYRRAATVFRAAAVAMVGWLAVVALTGDPSGRSRNGFHPARFLDRPVTATLMVVAVVGLLMVLLVGGSALSAGADGLRRTLLPNLRTSNLLSRTQRRRAERATASTRSGPKPPPRR